ncbi:MAG TPA: hypothetical protein VH325_18260 [Bryobacteraceae bacterium]|nr:hypothetical protein [Bryobacteraceae bacterium]
MPIHPNTPQPPIQLQTLEPNYQNPLSYQYSAGIQYSVSSDTLFAVGYSGSHQIHQGLNVNINQIPTADLLDVYNYEETGGGPMTRAL